MTTVIFKSPKVYYAGGFDADLETFKTTAVHKFNGEKY